LAIYLPARLRDTRLLDQNFLGGFLLHFGFEILVEALHFDIVPIGVIFALRFWFTSEEFRWLFSALAPHCVL
jgi:hypothetical protein